MNQTDNTEYVWTATYGVHRRKRKLFEKEERDRARMWGKHHTPTLFFASEVEARGYALATAEAELVQARKKLKGAEKQVERARAALTIAQNGAEACAK